MNKQEFDDLFGSLWGDDEAGSKSHIVQDPIELWQLVQKVQKLNPVRSLEIGTAHGGVTSFLHKISGQVVTVDANTNYTHYGDYTGGNPEPVFIEGESTDSEVIAAVEAFAPYDFLFIDGDHSYEGCKADWDNYSPMVRAGGLIGFHDVGNELEQNPGKVVKEAGLSYSHFLGRMGTALIQK
jgi:predicted O-methyltransferase YrrM